MYGCLLRCCLVLMLVVANSHAGISGRFEILAELDNRRLASEAELEERLDLSYQNPNKKINAGLSLGFVQYGNNHNEELSLLYVEKHLDEKGSLASIGRLQRADSLGFYTLDGLHLEQRGGWGSLTIYGGVPGRVENYRSVDGDALYGIDFQTKQINVKRYEFDGRLGWQYFKEKTSEERINLGGRFTHKEKPAGMWPTAISFSVSYRVKETTWENTQFSVHRDVADVVRLRLDYETYEPSENELTFKERFYSLYSRGRQSETKAGIQFKQNRQISWHLSGKHLSREFGSHGSGVTAGMDYQGLRGWQLSTQLDQQALSEERIHGFYIESRKTLTSFMRLSLSGVVQRQQKQLVGDNRTLGVDAILERRFTVKALPSPIWLSFETSYIDNSRLSDEYRIALRARYHFDDRTREAL